MKKMVSWIAGGLAVLILALGGFAYATYQSGVIEGTWRSPAIEHQAAEIIHGEMGTELADMGVKPSEFIKDITVHLTAVDDQATISVNYRVDTAYFVSQLEKLLLAEVDKTLATTDLSGFSAAEVSQMKADIIAALPTKEQMLTEIKAEMKKAATAEGLTYDEGTDVASGDLVVGTISPFTKTITITSSNANMGLLNGEYIKYSRDENKLTIEDASGAFEFDKTN